MWAAVEQKLQQGKAKNFGNSWTVTDICVPHYKQTGRDHFWHTRRQLLLAAAHRPIVNHTESENVVSKMSVPRIAIRQGTIVLKQEGN